MRLNGNPYFIRGAAGRQYPDELFESGGNSIRSYVETSQDLDTAQRYGLTVLVGIPMAQAGGGFRYDNPEAVAKQLSGIRETVRRHRDHPSLLMWALGDEPELRVSGAERVRLWRAIEEAARAVKQEDPNHPVITVIAGTDDGKVKEVAEFCPSLDALGINAFEKAATVPDALAEQGWNKAYVLTEYGPRSHREVETTLWGAPIEDDSTTKARLYLSSYQAAVEGKPNCLGSYAYLWGSKHVRTSTWYSMFLSTGSPTGAVDVVRFLWTGSWPVNRAPEIGPQGLQIALEGLRADTGLRQFPPGATIHCSVDADDPEGDPVIVAWEVRPDIAALETPPSNPEDPGADPAPPIEGLVQLSELYRAVIRVPGKPGHYRVFAYVRDSKGSAATVSAPIAVTGTL